MRRFAIVPALLCAVGLADGASVAERDVHFDTIQALVQRGLRLPASRAIEEFAASGYPDGDLFTHGIRFAYFDRFRIGVHGALIDEMKRGYQAELEVLKGRNNLPPKLQALVEGGGIRDLSRMVNLIIGPRGMNPDAPPRLVKFSVEKQQEFEARLEALIESADASLDAAWQEIEANKAAEQEVAALDWGDEKFKTVMWQATQLRYKYCNTLYITYKALREVMLRGDDFGLPGSIRRDLVEPWIHGKLRELMETFEEWDWTFADWYPYLKHRINIMRAEAVRLNRVREDLGHIKGNMDPSFDEVRSSIYAAIDLDLEPFDAKTRKELEAWKLEVWSDLLLWHSSLGDDLALRGGIEAWDDFQSRNRFSLDERDKRINQNLGHLYIVAARLLHRAGEGGRRDELLVELQRSKNFFAGNAKLWLTYFRTAGGDSGGSAWERAPEPVEPSVALTLSRALRSEARQAVDPVLQRTFEVSAAVQLRNGILGLPPEGDNAFIENAPFVYQSYAYTLYQMGHLYHAVAVVEDGLDRFEPLWQRPRESGGNPWKDRQGNLTQAGAMVKRLANDFLAYTGNLKRRADSGTVRDTFERAIVKLKIFDPENAKENLDKNLIIIDFQQGELDDAIAGLKSYRKRYPEDRMWALEVRAKIEWARYNQELDKEHPSETQLEAYRKSLDEALQALDELLGPVVRGEQQPPEGQEKAYESANRFVLGVRVATLVKAKEFAEVVKLLGPDFWTEVPDDPTLAQQLLKDLVISTYRLNLAIAKDRAKAKDPELLFAHWQDYVNAGQVFDQVLKVHPILDERLRNTRKALAGVFNVCQRQASWFLDQRKAGAPGFAELDGERLGAIAEEAKRRFARFYFPLINDQTKPDTILSIGLALWDLDEIEQAVQVFERYKKILAADADIQAFARDGAGFLQRFSEMFAVRQKLKPAWERKGEASIVDVLIDAPGFAQEMRDGNEADWSEEKRDFATALERVEAFQAVLDQEAEVMANGEELKKEAARLHQMVQGLAYQVSLDAKLVDGYQRLGRSDEAVALAEQLYAYDPLNPNFSMMVVEGVITGLADPQNAISRDQIIDARNIAAEVRLYARRLRTDSGRELYWTSFIQMLELSQALGEIDIIGKNLKRNTLDGNHPSVELIEPGTDPAVARNHTAVRLAQRYLAMYDVAGHKRPFRIEQNQAGQTVFIKEDN